VQEKEGRPVAGFKVNIDALHKYAGELRGDRSAVGRVGGLVAKADVGDKSWGVVGLFVKEQYSGMVSDLKDLMTEMEAGLLTAADKISTTSRRYQEVEDAHRKKLTEIVNGLDSVRAVEV
jgi:hypothetical protein